MTGKIGKLDRGLDYVILAVQILGILTSAFLLMVTFANSDQVKAGVQSFAIAKVERLADETWEATGQRLDGSTITQRLTGLSTTLGQDAEAIEEQRRELVPAVVAFVLSDKCLENCIGWTVFAGVLNASMLQKVADLRIGQSTLAEFIQNRYETTIQGLMTDIRRVGLVNVITLSLMALLLLVHRSLGWRLKALSIAITAYTVWAVYGYVAQQNWAMAILTQNWAGPAYQASMIIVSLFCIDWIFLRGRITAMIANAISVAMPG